MAGPRIACIGVIGKAVCGLHRDGGVARSASDGSIANETQDNPLHISLFSPYTDATIEFSFLLNSCLDIFEIRRKQTSIDQELGLLHAIDERLAAYGWLTTTGVKFLIIVNLIGPEVANTGKPAEAAVSGLRDSDLKPVCKVASIPNAIANHGS